MSDQTIAVLNSNPLRQLCRRHPVQILCRSSGCGQPVSKVIGCPDGAEIFQDWFDVGQQSKESNEVEPDIEANHPLPWRTLPAVTGKPMDKTMPADEAYACHAVNALPELLAAAKNLRNKWEHHRSEPMARLKDAIELAEDISEQ